MAMTMAQASAAMREAMRETVKRYSTWYLLEGIFLVIAGVIALAYPYLASVTLVFLLGWILIISGVLQAIGLIGAKDVPHFWLQLISAALAIVIGFLLLRNPNAGLLVMTVLLIVFFIVEGFSKIILPSTSGRSRVGCGCCSAASSVSCSAPICGAPCRSAPNGSSACCSAFS